MDAARFEIHHGDCLDVMRAMPDCSVQCCVTSPPYYGLRDYGHAGQIGLEPSVEEYVARLVEVFREVGRVLKPDGTLWLNLGDSYAATGGKSQPHRDSSSGGIGKKGTRGEQPYHGAGGGFVRPDTTGNGLKPKDLIGIPWRVAFALQADGWYLRQDIIWHKPNPMPESVRDRCTKAHEYVFLLTRSPRYFFDANAIKEDSVQPRRAGVLETSFSTGDTTSTLRCDAGRSVMRTLHRNKRSVWTVTPQHFKGSHFAVMPEGLVEPCILAGTRPGDTVLDPFAGSGTVGVVAARLGRFSVGIELNPEYVEMARARIESAATRVAADVTPSMFDGR